MAIAFFQTALPDQAALWWETEAGEAIWHEGGKAQGVLAAISVHTKEFKEGLRGVGVVQGPGRFSSLRVGILYAHMLARWYGVPLYALTLTDVETASARRKTFHAIMAGDRLPQSYVAPVYDRDPNITTPRV